MNISSFCYSNVLCSKFGSFFLDEYGDVWSIGCSNHGQLGHIPNKIKQFFSSSLNTNIFPIKKIKCLSNIKKVSIGFYNTICLDIDGNVFIFGKNTFKQKGINNSHIPQTIKNLPCINQISCGYYFAICLSFDNEIFGFGSNEKGYLGLGDNNKYYESPTKINFNYTIKYIISSAYYTICITLDDECYYWGDFKCLLEIALVPTKYSSYPDNIVDIKCSFNHTLLLTSKGQVLSFGLNNLGQLGIDESIDILNIPTLIPDIPEIQRIECGDNHSMCIDINNNLWVFGFNSKGQLGLGDTIIRYKPILHPILSNIIDISSGGDHTFVKTKDNKIYAFGDNQYSQLGIDVYKTIKYIESIPIHISKYEDLWYSKLNHQNNKSARK